MSQFSFSFSFFGWMSQFSAGISHFSASYLNFRLDIPTFFQTSQISSRCVIFRPALSFFVQLFQFSTAGKIRHPAENCDI
ncbi:hypothetical protein V9T40_002666 [Parthenolecanium corni]|uniref:Uncharacterized protein n=1 Tax=Parthenolecanium corni TaxID=536013 RepID=A0AAN9TL64_9HEMI